MDTLGGTPLERREANDAQLRAYLIATFRGRVQTPSGADATGGTGGSEIPVSLQKQKLHVICYMSGWWWWW